MLKRKPAFLIAITVLTSLLLFGAFLFMKSQVPIAHEKRIQQFEEGREKAGVMTVRDYEKLVSINKEITKSRAISDQNLDWMVTLLQARPIKDNQSNRVGKAITVTLYMSGLKTLSETQKQKLFPALSPFLTGPTTQENHALRLMAIRTLSRANVTLARPQIMKLADDSDEDVSREAKSALEYFTPGQN